MVPFEAFLSEKPVVTTTDAGGPLDVVARPRDRASSSSRDAVATRSRERVLAWLRGPRRRGDARGAARGKALAERGAPWDARDRRGLLAAAT